jgi:hypothetical protein
MLIVLTAVLTVVVIFAVLFALLLWLSRGIDAQERTEQKLLQKTGGNISRLWNPELHKQLTKDA